VISLAVIVTLATLGVGLVVSVALRFVPTVKLQLVGLALLAVVLPLGAVLLSGWVMFHMGDDVKILAVASASASAAVGAALALGYSLARRIDRLRESSRALARGDLAARAPEGGPAELAELARSFNEMAANLARLFDARRELVAWASHDLRTPIASMQAMIEALEDGLAEPAQYLPSLRGQVETLGRLVDDLFELARIDAGMLTLELREAPLASVVETCLRGFEAEAHARQVKLEARIDGDVAAWCAPEQVERVLFNLLTNALRHTPSDGAVAVAVEPGDEVVVRVEDTGEGITRETAGRMFDRFWRGDRARSSGTAGAGLGLAIAQGLIEAQGGRIWAENRPGGGTRVSFTLTPAAARTGIASDALSAC
jgi:signal transduction histidine kinase